MDYQLGPGPLQVDQNTIDEKIKGDIGIVENGDVATHAIPSGYYVIWKGDLYVAKTDISSGTTLSTSNLTAKPNGLGADVAALNSKLSYNLATATLNSEYIASGAINVIRVGNVAIINVSDLKFAKAFDGASSGNTITLATLPVNVKTAQVVLLQQMGSASNVRLMVESGNRIIPWWHAFSITTGNGYFGSFAVILN